MTSTQPHMEPTEALQSSSHISMMEGMVAVLLAIKKNHPELANSITTATKKCTTVIHQHHYALASTELKNLAQELHRHWQDKSQERSEHYKDIAERLASLPLDHFSMKQSDRFNALLSFLQNGHGTSTALAASLPDVLMDFSETIESLHKTSFNNLDVDSGEYTKGVDVVKKADLAAATSRMTNDVVRLLNQLLILHPGDSKIKDLNYRCKNLDKRKIHFFEVVDLLSESAWLVYRMNDKTLASQRDYLMKLVDQISSISGVSDQSTNLIDNSKDELNDFNSVVTEEFERLKNEAHDSSSLSDLKQILSQKMEILQGRLSEHVENQQKIIEDQKNHIENQRKSISDLKVNADTYRNRLIEETKRSLVDHLTEIPNRRAFDETIEGLHQEWKDGRIGNLAAIIVDIDRFKAVNDTYGHIVGDEALRYVSDKINKYCSSINNVFFSRYGGEEFALTVHSDNPKKILMVAREINQMIKEKPLVIDSVSINLTVSVGICFFSERVCDVNAVIEGADRALYRAKDNGRDKVWVANRIKGL